MTLLQITQLLLLAALWGASFLFMREGAPEFGPVALMALRTAIAALFLLPFLLMRSQQRYVLTHWRPILIVGLTNTAIPFCLFAYATLNLAAGYTSILNATAPMFAALIAFFWLGQALTWLAVIGLMIGFGGVFMLVLARDALDGPFSYLPVLAGLSAACLYGFAANYTKKALGGVPAMAIATGSQIYSALCLLPFALWSWPGNSPSAVAWWQVLALGIACTGFAYILYFGLIEKAGASNAIAVAYLVPVFGILWGALFLGEVLRWQSLVGGVLILLGVGLTTGIFKRFVTRTAVTDQ
ncbi:DMT family transporter [Aliiglaciecola sp. CAU 1673]|uniref:DMT family transporter n=1 Tax=Aliiglaciecola sp. CAU 1673 TaxID=3032595 RepID=UPI0023DC44E4|nr:DMT family transporter [Aliiglaciecola sp. CAU 1673]MDF2179660.1 DMT family transporter [Aliiglaciecola sp. CAU 1673]